MEKWKEVFIGTIPKAVYQVQLINGEKQGLTIKLLSSQTYVMINFGMVQIFFSIQNPRIDRSLALLSIRYISIR